MMDLQGITDTRTWCGMSENSKIAGWKPSGRTVFIRRYLHVLPGPPFCQGCIVYLL